MRTVPAFLADLAVHHGVCTPAQLRPFGRRVGEAVEVDLEALRAAGEDRTADWLAATWQHLRHNVGRETGTTGRRTLLSAVQLDTKKTRRDLREECEALIGLPGYGPLLDELLGAEPDLNQLTAALRALGAELHVEGQTATVRLVLAGLPAWPEALGGAPSPAEQARELVAVVRWAKWRDRRSRRLAALHVVALETWPAVTPALI